MTSRSRFTAVILAAGEGKRLGDLGRRYSKPMVPVAGRPLLQWSVDRLRAAGAERMLVVLHPSNQQLRDYAESSLPEIEMVLQPDRRGIADAVVQALPRLQDVEGFLCCACDSLFPTEEIAALADSGTVNPGTAGVGVLEMDLAATRARSSVRVEGGRVVEIVEKPEQPSSPLIALPIYWLPLTLEPFLRSASLVGGEQHVTSALSAFIASGGRVTAQPFSQRLELTSPEDLAAIAKTLSVGNEQLGA